jgi:hypothetical protein
LAVRLIEVSCPVLSQLSGVEAPAACIDLDDRD